MPSIEEQQAIRGLNSPLYADLEGDSTNKSCTVAILTTPEAQEVVGTNLTKAQASGGKSTEIKNTETELNENVANIDEFIEMFFQKPPVVDPLKNYGYDIVTPHKHDILSGRGNGANNHPGNIFFRELIQKYQYYYINTDSSEKKLIPKRIVEILQQRNPPGRFLEINYETLLWDCLDIDRILKKICQALRDKKSHELKRKPREEYKTKKITCAAEPHPHAIQHRKIPIVQMPIAAPDVVTVTAHPHDVIFYNGDVLLSHPGGKFFYEQVKLLLPQYKGIVVYEKRIEQKIIETVGARWPPGRFLCNTNTTSDTTKNENCSNWQMINFNETMNIISTHLQRAYSESRQIDVPNQCDVLLEVRGNNSRHQGNIYFHSLIEKYCNDKRKGILMTSATSCNQNQNICFMTSTTYERNKAEKCIAKQIVEEVEHAGGRFLKFNNQKKSLWEPLDFKNTISKVLQFMRDYQKSKRREQKHSKQVRFDTCVMENVVPVDMDSSAKNNGDPPGVFFNYYSSTTNSNEDQENQSFDIANKKRKDPPGQVFSMIMHKKSKDNTFDDELVNLNSIKASLL